VTYLQRQAKNEGVVDLMKRLPEGGTKRDLLSDPAMQADRQRDAMRGMYGNDRFESRLPATCSRFWQRLPCAKKAENVAGSP
jgi:hypothetical protein